MKCDYHKDREAVGVCNHCGRHLCEECQKYKEKYMLCPKCNEEYLTYNYTCLRRGVYLTFLDFACSMLLLSMYINELRAENPSKLFIILGGIFNGIFIPFCIFYCIHTIVGLVKTKNELIYIKSSDYRNNPIAKTSSKKQEEVSKNQAKKGTVKQELEKEATKERAKSKQKNKFVPSELFSQKDYDHIKSLMDQESQTLTEEQLDEYDLQQFEAMEKEMNKKKKK